MHLCQEEGKIFSSTPFIKGLSMFQKSINKNVTTVYLNILRGLSDANTTQKTKMGILDKNEELTDIDMKRVTLTIKLNTIVNFLFSL